MPGYRLTLPGGPVADLSDPSGRVWSRLSLLASLDRVDAADESYDPAEPWVSQTGDGVTEVRLRCRSTAWAEKTVILRCFDDRLELRVAVAGTGVLGAVKLLGGQAILPGGAGGTFRSSLGFGSVFNPAPTEPVSPIRPASAACALGVVGDASAGRLHGIFSPPPLYLAFGGENGDWLTAGVVAGVEALRFTQLRYLPLDGGFLLELDYDGHTTVTGSFTTPALVLRPAPDPWLGLAAHREDLVGRGLAPRHPAWVTAADDRPHPASATATSDQPRPLARADWWSEPIFCGWGAQCARAGKGIAPPDLARADLYDRWLARLESHGVVPGTIVIDDRWQAEYGTATPDPERWPDLRGWIERRHASGQRVLLWWKAWDPSGLPAEECVTDPSGRPIAADPGSPAYRERLRRMVFDLLGTAGAGADGFKVDFTQRCPAGRALSRPGAEPGAPWGIAALHLLLRTIYDAAKRAKPDALIVAHAPHPAFADVCDMVRLNDILESDPSGAPVPAVDQLAFRHAVAGTALPHHLIDTDQWPIADLAQWRAYVLAQSRLGVPALYYAERLDRSGEELGGEDLALVASTWHEYRQRRGPVIPRQRGAESRVGLV
jgi:hypothetical protein